jgi:hypothetical protein
MFDKKINLMKLKIHGRLLLFPYSYKTQIYFFLSNLSDFNCCPAHKSHQINVLYNYLRFVINVTSRGLTIVH